MNPNKQPEKIRETLHVTEKQKHTLQFTDNNKSLFYSAMLLNYTMINVHTPPPSFPSSPPAPINWEPPKGKVVGTIRITSFKKEPQSEATSRAL